MAADESAPDPASITIGVRMKPSLRALIESYIGKDTHTSIGDFLRDAAREKIRRDAPALYKSMFLGERE